MKRVAKLVDALRKLRRAGTLPSKPLVIDDRDAARGSVIGNRSCIERYRNLNLTEHEAFAVCRLVHAATDPLIAASELGVSVFDLDRHLQSGLDRLAMVL